MTRAPRLLRVGVLAALLGAAACGQRGPLFLPEPPEAETARPATEDGDPERDRDRDDDER